MIKGAMPIEGTLQVAKGERVGVVLKQGAVILAQAAVTYSEDEEARWAHYCFPSIRQDSIFEKSRFVDVCIENQFHTVIKQVPVDTLEECIVQQSAHVAFIERAAPSFGFIGGALNQPLLVSANMPLKRVRITVKTMATYLNFSGLALLGDTGSAISADVVKSTQYSSKLSPHVDIHSITNQGFHSDLDDHPWLEIEFKQPEQVSEIRFINRGDVWGFRSRQLCITGFDCDGREHLLHSNGSAENKLMVFNVLERQLGQFKFHTGLSKEQVLDALVTFFFDAKNLVACEQEVVELIPHFLSSWRDDGLDEHTELLELKLLAAYLVYFMRVQISLNLLCFERLLNKRHRLEVLENNINILRGELEEPLIEITKHGTALASKLTTQPELFVSSIKTLIDDLTILGAKPCLAYGTLLGAVRDGAFIAHDDDVDIFVELPQQNLNEREALDALESITAQLDPSKYVVNRASPSGESLNLHVYVIETAVLIDVFPYWYNGDKAKLHMEKMQFREISASILRGRTMLSLYGELMPVPANAEEFLAERYGDSWATPDKFHEWPWKLED